VIAYSKRVFVAFASDALRSSARRRLTFAVLGALAIAILPSLSGAAPSPIDLVTKPAASSGWLDRLNAWRSSTGLSSLSENSVWSQGDYNHALYMIKNDLVTHYETAGTPYYTPAGDTAAQNSNIQVSSTTSVSDTQAIDWWMAAPFHAMGMMDPRLTQTGFGSYREVKSGWQEGGALDTLRGNSFTGGQYPVYFPGNGATEPLTTYSGGEFPDPLQACPGYSSPTGLPVFVQVGGNVATTAGPIHSITGNGQAVENCVIDSNSPSVGSGLRTRGGVILIPRQPLHLGVTYVVALTVNGSPYTWSFTVGSTLTSSPPYISTAFKGLYTVDGWGGINADDSTPVAVSSYWPGWKIVRTAKALPGASAPQAGFVLDGYGGLHPYGSPVVTETSGNSGHYWSGWDIARDFAFLPDGTGGFVLDGFGGLHPFRVNGSTAPLQAQGYTYWQGWDIARKMVIFPDGSGGYTMDAYGGVHPFGINGPAPASATNVVGSAYWPGWEIARDIVLVPGNGTHSGYVLDGYGGLQPFHPTADGSTMPAAIPTSYWQGWDIARAVWLLPGSGSAGYTLDGYGGLHPFGAAAAIRGSTYWGVDIAQVLVGS
jgi:cysteine-rich secretory family protein